MATRTTVLEKDAHFYWCTWEGIQENGGVFDDGDPVSLGGARQLHIGATGNFDTSFTVEMHGSNDATNWFVMHDLAGDPVIFTASVSSFTVGSPPRFLKPQGAVLGAADASDVDIFLSASRR